MKSRLLLLALFGFVSAFAQQKIRVHHAGNTMYASEISNVQDIKFDATYAKFNTGTSLDIQKTLVDSLTFTTNAVNLDKIYIIYNGQDNATIINPYANQGISITASAGLVTATAASGIANLEYHILGSSANGRLNLATDQNVVLKLNNLNLTNPSGAAFNITGGKTTTVDLSGSNTLTDGTASTANGTLQTDGPIVLSGSGSLSIAGLKKHGISTTSTVTMNGGTVAVTSAVSDGLHSEGFSSTAGTLNITATADGIDAGNGAISISGGTIGVTSTSADVKGIKTGNGTITMTGGSVTVVSSGAQSKAISAKGNITISAGTINVTLSGATVLTADGSGFDPSYAAGIKTDGVLAISGGTFNMLALSDADGGKVFSADGVINVSGGTFTVTTAGNGGTYTNASGVADAFSTSGFTSDSDINISGGTLTVTNTGIDGKAFSSDTNINVSATAQITVSNSGNAGKGFKADGNVTFAGGATNITVSGAATLTAAGSGFDPSYPTAIKTDGNITVDSGSITITATTAAKGAKGLSADGSITVNGGTISVTNGGAGQTYTNALGVLDAYSAAAFSADVDLILNGGAITTTSSGSGGKGLKADGAITIGSATSGPTLNITTTGQRFLVSGTDYSHPKTLVADGAITINSGTNTFNSTDDGIHSDTSVTINGGTNTVNAISTVQGMGEGVEGPLLYFNGGVTSITASNDGINATYGTVAGGTESNDGSHLYISGGIVIVAGKDAIDSNGNITISGGTTVVCGPTSSPEEGLDFNGTFLMNGGILISAGSNSQMTKNAAAASTQPSMFLKSSQALAANSLLHIRNASGTEMVTFKPKNNVYYFHFSSPNVAQNTSYNVYFGGSYTGGTFVGGVTDWGLYTGGTYTLGTLKKTFTTSGSATINTVTF